MGLLTLQHLSNAVRQATVPAGAAMAAGLPAGPNSHFEILQHAVAEDPGLLPQWITGSAAMLTGSKNVLERVLGGCCMLKLVKLGHHMPGSRWAEGLTQAEKG